MSIVFDTEKPSLRLASCCRVEVVNGGAGFFSAGFFSILLTVYSAPMHLFRNATACSFDLNREGNSAFSSVIFPFSLISNKAETR